MSDSQTDSKTLVCHACSALNRVPATRELSEGKCGKCGVGLATIKPVEINGPMLARLKAKDTGAFVVDVWAPWCAPCRSMAPSYDYSAKTLKDRVRLFKLNSEANQDAAARLGLRGVPTLIAWNGGREMAVQSGAQTGAALTNWIRQSTGE